MSDAPNRKSFDWNDINLFAMLSLILSLVGIGIGGIILGHIALSQLKTKPQSGRALAIAGLAIGYASIAVGLVAIFFYFLAMVIGGWGFGAGMHNWL